MISLSADLRSATTLPELSAALGRECVNTERVLIRLLADQDIQGIWRPAVTQIEASDPSDWIAIDGSYTAYDVLESLGLAPAIEALGTLPPLGHWAVLRGLCGRVLPHFYLGFEGRLPLEQGMPIPQVMRPIHTLFNPDKPTPQPENAFKSRPFEASGFKLFDAPTGASPAVELDFSVRDRLDEITWSDKNGLAKVGSVHPYLGEENVEIDVEEETWFFGVHPKDWNADGLLSELERLAAVTDIAVLPELCLPSADALEYALSAEPGRYPPLLVAGSAHIVDSDAGAEVRANECRIYIDGNVVSVHRKIHPFDLKTNHIAGQSLRRCKREGLTAEEKTLTVLCGDKTALAVVICADLNDSKIPELLKAVGANLVLVPAMTNGEGAFAGAIGLLASFCQAVAVVVNASLDPIPGAKDEADPFLIMAAVPRPSPEEQARTYHHAAARTTRTGVIDPNRKLEEAMVWM